MGTTLAELRRKVLMGYEDVTGSDILIAEEAINQACHAMAEINNFEELLVTDLTNAKTVIDQKRYHLVTDWLLTRPKDILSIVLHDDFNSRKLSFMPTQHVDTILPYPEGITTGKPSVYNKQGDYVDLFILPDAVYDLYIRYYQWPLVLVNDSDECSYTNQDSLVIAIARDIFIALRSKLPLDTIMKAKMYMKTALGDDRVDPDEMPVARGFNSSGKVRYTGEYWNNPFIRSTR